MGNGRMPKKRRADEAEVFLVKVRATEVSVSCCAANVLPQEPAGESHATIEIEGDVA